MQSTRRFQTFFLALFCTTGIGFHLWLESKLPAEVTTRVDLFSAGMVIFTIGWIAFGAEPAHTEEQVGHRWYVQYRTALWAGLVYYLGLVILTHEAPGEIRLILMAYGIFMTASFGFGTIVSPALGPRRIDRYIQIDKKFLPALPAVGIMLSYVLRPDPTAVPAITCSAIATVCVFMMREFIQVRLNNHHGLFVAARAERDAQIASKQAFLAAAGHDFDQPLQAARLSFDQALRLSGADQARAVGLILTGERFIPGRVLDLIAARGSGGGGGAASGPLTARQLDVLRLLAQGLTNKEIARELVLSPATVKAHAAAIFETLGAANRTEAVSKAQGLRLLA